MAEQTPFRVLIVDDSPTMRAVCMDLLTKGGFRCAAAADAQVGYRMLGEAIAAGQPFDGLLLDWLMPGMNGWELLERIGAERRLDTLAVMIFTEQPDDRAYQLASLRPNNDIQLKEDLTLLPYRMRKFLTTYSEVGGMGDWRARQLLKSREPLGGSILFVDDSPTVCAKYSDLLRNNGYTVLVADSMTTALEQARRHKPQLAVVDYFMPGGNGDLLCRALLGDDRTRDITVVMHSQRKDVIEVALDAGAIDLIWKDDPINIFLMRIASIMRTLRANRQAKDLDILFAATQALDIGVMSATPEGFRAFNATMDRFARECGGLERFDPRHVTALPQRLNDRVDRRRAFNIQTVDGGDGEVVLVQDVTETAEQAEVLEKARDQAVELAQAKAQFLASMSHEIRTPLNGVIGMLELLKGTALDSEQVHYVDTGITSAEGLLGVIGDILDFSKIDAGRLELEHTAFHLPDLAEEAMQMLATRAMSQGLEAICCVEPNVPVSVIGDPTRLRQVLLNLLGNAIKFTEHGEVGLRVWLDEPDNERPEIGFAVCDTGIGIAAQAREHIFEAFRQADNSTTRRFGGTGLGLAISHQLVHMMGGTLDVESTPGDGSSFMFVIPLEAAPAAASAPAWHSADSAVLADRRVLIVDDNATNRLYLAHLCRAWSMTVVEAADGPEALARFAAARAAGEAFDLLLLDRMMPGMDGMAVLREVRADPANRLVRVVLQTSMDELGEAKVAREFGADDTLVKPVRRGALLETLSHLFGGGHADPKEVHRTPPGLRLDGCRVLAVEDNAVNQMVLDGILKRAGCDVTIANHGAEALDVLEHQAFNVVLMDCEMPVLDGLSATRALREREATAGAPSHQVVVALTAHAFPAERDRCLAAGMDDYLPKPIRAPDLLATLQRWWRQDLPDAAPEPAPAPAVHDHQPPSLDPYVIDALREAIGELAPVFEVAMKSLPERLEALGIAVGNGDTVGIRTEAHTLAGSCGNLGATEAMRRARAVEAAGRSADLPAAPALYAALKAEFDRLLPAIERLMAEERAALV